MGYKKSEVIQKTNEVYFHIKVENKSVTVENLYTANYTICDTLPTIKNLKTIILKC